MEIITVQVKILKFNYEYLISCLKEAERITNINNSTLKQRAIDILENSVFTFLNNNTIEHLEWIIESNNNFIRYYPDNVLKKSITLLDDEMDKIFKNIADINEIIFKTLGTLS